MKYFKISELCNSPYALSKNIDNRPFLDDIKNMEILIKNVLDPIRELFGSAIYISSGYRCKSLNRALGGVSNSHHTKGMASDLTVNASEDLKILFDIIKVGCQFTQLIFEDNGKTQWIHVSYDKDDLKNQILYMKDGEYFNYL